MRPVYLSAHAVDGEVVKTYLERHGIAAVVLNEHTALSMNITGLPTVWVLHDEDESRAIQIIAERGKESSNLAPWPCSVCSEENDGQFGVCWKCGATAPPL